jgi:hypothetical protein
MARREASPLVSPRKAEPMKFRFLSFHEVAVCDPLSATAMALGAAGAATSAAGTLSGAAAGAGALRAQGPATMLAAVYKSQEDKYAADTALASSQRQAIDAGQQKDLVLSKIQAGAAATGGDTADDTVVNLAGQTEAKGEYQQLMDLFNGTSKFNALNDQANNDLVRGENQVNADNYRADTMQRQAGLSAAGTIMGGMSSMASKYIDLHKDSGSLKGSYPEANYAIRMPPRYTAG